MPLISLSLEPAVCLLSWSEADQASETAPCSGMPWTGGVLLAWMGWCGWYLPCIPASISTEMVLVSPRERDP